MIGMNPKVGNIVWRVLPCAPIRLFLRQAQQRRSRPSSHPEKSRIPASPGRWQRDPDSCLQRHCLPPMRQNQQRRPFCGRRL